MESYMYITWANRNEGWMRYISSWLFYQVTMKDIDSNEELEFKFDRWLAYDKDNNQICHELPAVRDGQESLSGIRIRN